MAISQELSLERVLQIIVDSVRPLVAADYAALGIPDERGQAGALHHERHQRRGPARHRPASPRPRAARRGHARRSGDARHGHRGQPAERRLPGRITRPCARFLGVPVRVEGRVIGNLYLTDKAGGQPFDEEDEQLVESFARHAGLAIHNARMHEELRQLAVLQERERIAQDLHDGSIQSLYAVSLALEDTEELMAHRPGDGRRSASTTPSRRSTARSRRSATSSSGSTRTPARRSTCWPASRR